MTRTKKRFLILGPLLFILLVLFLPESLFTIQSRAAVGTFAWMATWWIGQPVEPAVTALVPVITNSLFSMVNMSMIISQYMSETTFLVLSATIVCQTWKETKLDRRLALKALSMIGTSVKQQIVTWFLLSVVLSTVFPNLLVGLMTLPIAFAMLKFSGEIKDERDVSKSNTASLILSATVWGTYVGGMGTPLGGSMNLVAVQYLEQLTGHEFMYINWFLRILPLLVCIATAATAVLLVLAPKNKHLSGTKEHFKENYQALPPISKQEIFSAVLFFVPVILVFLRPLFAAALPGFKNAYIFLFAAFLTFFVKGEDNKPLLTWKKMEKELSWSLLFMLSSGLALGTLLTETQTIQVVADFIGRSPVTGGIGTLLIFNLFSMFIAEISNSIVSASLSIPIITSVTQGLGLNPIPYIYINIAAFNSAFMMPTAVRSMPIGYGVEPKFIIKNGLYINIAVMAVVTIVGYLMLTFFPEFLSVA